jgi:hypothetical protein
MTLGKSLTLFASLLLPAASVMAQQTGHENEHVLKCAEGTKTNFFSARPGNINLGASVTLRWSVTQPVGCNFPILLNRRPVKRSDTRVLQPLGTTSYDLVLSLPGGEADLGEALVSVILLLWSKYAAAVVIGCGC